MRMISALYYLPRACVRWTSRGLSAPVDRRADHRQGVPKSTFADIGTRIGEDNEALRNLLIDTSHQFSALDALAENFANLVQPLNQLMDTLEQEKSENASLRGALTEIRGDHETLRTEYQEIGKKFSELEADNEQLNGTLTSTQQAARQLEADKVTLRGEIAALRAALTHRETQLEEEISSTRSLGDENRLLLARADLAEKRIVELESDGALARERISLLESDKEVLQAALDQTLADASGMSRRVVESESMLFEAREQAKQMELSLAAAEDERKRLVALCDEANERRQSEVYALNLKLDAMHARCTAVENLLAEVRQNLVRRSEEIRSVEAKTVEANAGRKIAEQKAEELAAVVEAQNREIKKFEQARLSLTIQYNVLAETVKTREASLAHTQEKIKSLNERIEHLVSGAAAKQAMAEKRIEEITAALERERTEHALAEGALETARSDYARLQRETTIQRAMRRYDANHAETVATTRGREPLQPKNGQAGGHGDKTAAQPENGESSEAQFDNSMRALRQIIRPH